MNQDAILLTTLRALRNSMAAAVDLIDVVLDSAERPNTTEDAPTECPHPRGTRIDKATMGHPSRFYCPQCKQEVEE